MDDFENSRGPGGIYCRNAAPELSEFVLICVRENRVRATTLAKDSAEAMDRFEKIPIPPGKYRLAEITRIVLNAT